MESHFTTLLRTFVDCYERDPGGLEYGLTQAAEGIAANHEESRFKDEWKALRVSRKRTAQAVRKRILEIFGERRQSTEVQAADLDVRPHKAPAETWEEYQQERAAEFRGALAAEWGLTREALDELLAEGGFTDEDGLLALTQMPKYQDIEAKHKFAELARTNFHVFFAREFLEWLDVTVAQVESLQEIEFRKSIPEHLRRFLGEAYRCYLYGLDAACAALCGAILQEAIRVKLNVEGFQNLDQAINAACKGDLPLLTEKAEKAAREVKGLRNLASHGNREFAESQEYRRKYPLSLTREVLDTLFAEEI
jgi:hypothetical protein